MSAAGRFRGDPELVYPAGPRRRRTTVRPPMTEAQARHLAASWHGGQWSALYALASTGAIVRGVEHDVRECIREAEAQGLTAEVAHLTALLAWLESR